jgi:hypothetical protein
VEARNAYGLSFFSNTVTILAAQIPAQPQAPVTLWDKYNDEVTVTWNEPDNGGSPITGYKLTLRQNDLDYTYETTYCDMITSTLTSCTIPVTVFRSTPFDLPWGSSIWAKVIATNLYGDSA